jgi:hypothetical protein
MMMRVCGVMFAVACIGGFAVYTVAYLPTNATFPDTVSAALRGMFSMMRMFFVNDDYGHLLETPEAAAMLQNIWWQIAFWTLHIFATFVALSMILAVFGRKLTDNIRIWIHANMPLGKNGCHYVVVGCGTHMEIFLNDLCQSVSIEKITIITGDCIEGAREISDNHPVYKKLVDRGFAVIKGSADSKTLKRTGAIKPFRSTKVVAISGCDKQNLEIGNIIARKIACESHDKVKLEAYIMYSFIERTEHFAFAESTYGKVRFFNMYELRVRDFFNNNPVTGMIPDLIDKSKARLAGELNHEHKIIKPNTAPNTDNSEYMIKNIFVGFGASNYQMLKGSLLTGQLLGCDYNAVVY